MNTISKAHKLSRRQFLIGASSAAATSLLLVACATTAPAGDDSASDDAPAQAPEELALMMVDYTEATQQLFADDVLPAFGESVLEGTEVTVNYSDWNRYNEEMTTAFAGGITPDVFQGGAVWAPQMAQRGWATPLDDYIATTGDAWDWDDFFESLRDDVTIDGQVVAVPYRIDVRSFWYRQDHLDEAGVAAPTTWDELRETAITLTQREGDQITREGFHYSGPGGWQNDLQPYMIFLRQGGGDFLNEDFTECLLNEEPAVATLEFIRQLIVEDRVQPYPGFEEQGNLGAYELGLASMTVSNADVEKNALLYAPEQAEQLVATLPLTGEQQATHAWVNKYFLSSQSQNADAGWQLLQYLSNPENTIKFCDSTGTIPPRASAGDADFMTENMQVTLASAEYAFTYPKYWRIIELLRPLSTNMEACLRGDATPQEAMDAAAAEIEQILAEG